MLLLYNLENNLQATEQHTTMCIRQKLKLTLGARWVLRCLCEHRVTLSVMQPHSAAALASRTTERQSAVLLARRHSRRKWIFIVTHRFNRRNCTLIYMLKSPVPAQCNVSLKFETFLSHSRCINFMLPLCSGRLDECALHFGRMAFERENLQSCVCVYSTDCQIHTSVRRFLVCLNYFQLSSERRAHSSSTSGITYGERLMKKHFWINQAGKETL